MAVAERQHQIARPCRTAPGRFSGTQLRRHPARTLNVRPTTAYRPQPCPAVMCDRETVDANTVGEFCCWAATIVRGAIHDRIRPRYRAFHPARAAKVGDRAG